jgi:predicted lipoprotein
MSSGKISAQQVVQQVRFWYTRHDFVGHQVAKLLANAFAWWSLAITNVAAVTLASCGKL